MIHDDLIRQILLAATGAVFVGLAAWAAVAPRSLASTVGYRLDSANAMSEFHAIYFGVFLAQALLCGLAVTRIDDAIIGDLVAIFVLAQPLGRTLAWFRWGWPTGPLAAVMLLELLGGLAILQVRPAG
jgi:hypothetical protein